VALAGFDVAQQVEEQHPDPRAQQRLAREIGAHVDRETQRECADDEYCVRRAQSGDGS
jgi:hypothetical protein